MTESRLNNCDLSRIPAWARPLRTLIVICVWATLFLCPPLRADESEQTSREAFFRKQVEPILVGRCLECHGSERKGELDLRTKQTTLKGGESGAAIEPSKPDESLLYEYVVSEEMPPKTPLSAEETAVL